MTTSAFAHPPIVSRNEWLAERKKLLEHEKDVTKHHDRVNAERRRLPMVKIEKAYAFDGPEGKQSLKDLFDGRRQLIIYHFMFDPEWDKGCSGCTGYVDALGDLSVLNDRDRCHDRLLHGYRSRFLDLGLPGDRRLKKLVRCVDFVESRSTCR